MSENYRLAKHLWNCYLLTGDYATYKAYLAVIRELGLGGV